MRLDAAPSVAGLEITKVSVRELLGDRDARRIHLHISLTQPHDRAWQQLSEYLQLNWQSIAKREFELSPIQ